MCAAAQGNSVVNAPHGEGPGHTVEVAGQDRRARIGFGDRRNHLARLLLTLALGIGVNELRSDDLEIASAGAFEGGADQAHAVVFRRLPVGDVVGPGPDRSLRKYRHVAPLRFLEAVGAIGIGARHTAHHLCGARAAGFLQNDDVGVGRQDRSCRRARLDIAKPQVLGEQDDARRVGAGRPGLGPAGRGVRADQPHAHKRRQRAQGRQRPGSRGTAQGHGAKDDARQREQRRAVGQEIQGAAERAAEGQNASDGQRRQEPDAQGFQQPAFCWPCRRWNRSKSHQDPDSSRLVTRSPVGRQ